MLSLGSRVNASLATVFVVAPRTVNQFTNFPPSAMLSWCGNSMASQTLDKFCELEELAEEILDDKQQIIQLDKKRNTNREALTTLKKHALPGEKPSVKSWVCIGNTFFKLPNSNVQKMLQQDQKNIEEEITKLRNDLKPKVSKLHELEGLPEVKGFDLTALTSNDAQTFR